MADSTVFTHDISIVIAGAAGQGVQTVELLLTRLLKLCGYNFFSTKEYMSRVRGGSNSTEIRVSSNQVTAYVETIDILFPLNRDALLHVANRIGSGTLILGEEKKLADESGRNEYPVIDIPFSSLSGEIGGPIFSNIISVGIVTGLFGLEKSVIESFMSLYFARKGEDIVSKNLQALKTGYDIGRTLIADGTIAIDISPEPQVKDDVILNGAEAVGIGALAGGCNFIATYPMSPATAVLVFLAQQSKEFDIIAEQAEDEIAGINMALGAWYAGARALVSTSGGGFALMTEGTSLAGMIESPVVIHIAQRPGPATGLPTRTEQGDLDLALYAGHGEFPRVIYAPGTIEDGVFLTSRAFDQADTYQVPVFILTDQYYIDTYYNTKNIDAAPPENDSHIIRTGKDYKRYELTESGVSPRGIPGYGDGLVVVDSDEHDEGGHITENLDIRVDMVDKRLRKLELLKKDALPPERIGAENNRNLIVCWGSTYHIVREALERTGLDTVSMLHFKQVYPLPDTIADYFCGVENIAIVENNATSQFGRLLKLCAGIDIQHNILKYNGMPFSVEELAEKIEETFSGV